MDIDRLVAFYETLSPDSIVRFGEFYAPDAAFKDPFNEVRGLEAIQRIFRHMFQQVDAPRFEVVDRIADAGGAVLVWEFHFGVQRWGRGQPQQLRGASHFKFGPDGKVVLHRDYWDAAEELYMKLPVVGALMRGLRRLFAS